jgi:hypothetical protein
MIVLGVLAAALGVLAAAFRRRRLLEASALLTVAGFLAFAIAMLAVARDYRDANGFIDCWPDCSAFQENVRLAVLTGPTLALLGFVGLGVVQFLGRR